MQLMFGRSRRYSIQIKDANGASLLLIKASWTEKERRASFAEIERLAGLPEVNVNTGPVLLEPQSDTETRRSLDRSIVGNWKK
jgi:hypothetical protein